MNFYKQRLYTAKGLANMYCYVLINYFRVNSLFPTRYYPYPYNDIMGEMFFFDWEDFQIWNFKTYF